MLMELKEYPEKMGENSEFSVTPKFHDIMLYSDLRYITIVPSPTKIYVINRDERVAIFHLQLCFREV